MVTGCLVPTAGATAALNPITTVMGYLGADGGGEGDVEPVHGARTWVGGSLSTAEATAAGNQTTTVTECLGSTEGATVVGNPVTAVTECRWPIASAKAASNPITTVMEYPGADGGGDCDVED